MPTTTFFNLPNEKREKLIQAIKDELCRVSFDKASINKIVQAAQIPRGSFYQYFENKQDMLRYILTDYQNQLIDLIKQSLHASGGDLFQLFEDMFEFAIRFALDDPTNGFCKNIFADLTVNAGFYVEHTKEEVLSILMKDIIPYVDTNRIDIRSEEDLPHIVLLLASTCRDSIAEAFMGMSTYEESRKNYFARLALLKRGFLKDKGEI
jgi:AcrR family transcriptional regulator